MATGIYVGVGGKARNVKSLYVGVNGKARRVTKGYIGVGGKARLFYAAEEIGKQWIFTSNGTFTVPVTGKYTIELHAKGGNGGSGYTDREGVTQYYGGGGGGGSGSRYENVRLFSGKKYNVSVSERATMLLNDDGDVIYSVDGGENGKDASASNHGGSGGNKAGNISQNGTSGGGGNDGASTGNGGWGGCSVEGYTDRGNGGDGGGSSSNGETGKSGVAIITFTSY